MEELQSNAVVSHHSGDERVNDDYVAVDPVRCGCTQCIVGDYIPEENWEPRSGDIYGLVSGGISNHTNNSDFGLVFQSSFKDYAAKQFITEMEEEFDSVVGYAINLDQIASWAY